MLVPLGTEEIPVETEFFGRGDAPSETTVGTAIVVAAILVEEELFVAGDLDCNGDLVVVMRAPERMETRTVDTGTPGSAADGSDGGKVPNGADDPGLPAGLFPT